MSTDSQRSFARALSFKRIEDLDFDLPLDTNRADKLPTGGYQHPKTLTEFFRYYPTAFFGPILMIGAWMKFIHHDTLGESRLANRFAFLRSFFGAFTILSCSVQYHFNIKSVKDNFLRQREQSANIDWDKEKEELDDTRDKRV